MKLLAKIVTSAMALVMIGTAGVVAFGATETTVTEPNLAQSAFGGRWLEERPARIELTDGQKEKVAATSKEILDEQLADGTITQEQYDQWIICIENGGGLSFGCGRGMGMGMGQLERTELTDEQKAEMTANAKAMLDEQLANGTITQEQYDQAIVCLESGGGIGFGLGLGKGMGMGQQGGRGRAR